MAQISQPTGNPSSDKDCSIQTSFRLKNFIPGDYTLRIKATDLNAEKSVVKDIRFVVSD